MMISATSSAQTDTTAVEQEGPWKIDGTFSFNLNESTYSNWVAGGKNQLSTLTIIKPLLTFDNHKWQWITELDVRHGMQKVEENKPTKSHDVLKFETKLGRRISEKWNFSGFYSLNTQGRPSYDNEILKSTFMSPGYTNLNLGFDFLGVKDMSIYLSPANLRSTYVLNDTLSAQGKFGVNPGSFVLFKFGPSFLLTYKGELFKNVLVDTKLGYFQNILDGLGDPIVNLDGIISIKLNKYFATIFTIGVFYDEDSKADVKDDAGNVTGQKAYVQFKQSFGFGINYNW
jgi:hypothetical protein